MSAGCDYGFQTFPVDINLHSFGMHSTTDHKHYAYVCIVALNLYIH